MSKLAVSLVLFFVYSIFSKNLRNPFLPIQNRKEIVYQKEVDNVLNLDALLKTKAKKSAIISKGFEKELVFLGTKVWGYKVVKIDSNKVLLKGENGKRLILS